MTEQATQQSEWIKDPTEPISAMDIQIGGDHYKQLGDYQPWQVLPHWLTKEELTGAMKFTVITYLARSKNGLEDIEKAGHTIQLYLEAMQTYEQKT